MNIADALVAAIGPMRLGILCESAGARYSAQWRTVAGLGAASRAGASAATPPRV
jgi:hypothetical protein